MAKNEEKWYEALDSEDVRFLQELAKSDFKLSKLSETSGMSYFVLRKKMGKLKSALTKKRSTDTDFEEYLNVLVEQQILPRSIAKVLYKKHLESK